MSNKNYPDYKKETSEVSAEVVKTEAAKAENEKAETKPASEKRIEDAPKAKVIAVYEDMEQVAAEFEGLVYMFKGHCDLKVGAEFPCKKVEGKFIH